MRALSLWQPWASAIALGAKRVETRDWSTRYRGPLAIHAAKRVVRDELVYCATGTEWAAALWPLGFRRGDSWKHLRAVLPFGAVVAVCRLVDCRSTASFTVAELDERRRRP